MELRPASNAKRSGATRVGTRPRDKLSAAHLCAQGALSALRTGICKDAGSVLQHLRFDGLDTACTHGGVAILPVAPQLVVLVLQLQARPHSRGNEEFAHEFS
eukprot:SAG11_NODE_3060_length_2718_cov_5.725468_2_plen_102_part_00